MTETELDTLTAPPAPLGQATAIEQARAVAEVQGAIVVAQQCPRNKTFAVQEMRESCAQLGLAERAFFRYNRAGSQITGPSVHLARELARCWGNIQYGLAELRRDDARGESEILAFAWDVQTNTRATTTFIVKHGRDTRDGRRQLTDLRDIYENNANNGARRLREQIFAVLPKWFTAEAQERCHATLERGDSEKPLAGRIADLVKGFDGMGVTPDALERKLGRVRGEWTPNDVATLTVVGRSIRNSETTVDDEFPDSKVTVDEITAPAEAAPRRGSRRQTTRAEVSAEDIAAMNAEANAAQPDTSGPTDPAFQLDTPQGGNPA